MTRARRDSRAHPRTPPEGETFALLELPNGTNRLEPLLDLSPTGLAVLVRTSRPAFELETRLPRVRLFATGECTLDSPATVRSVSEVSLEGGGIGQKLGLLLQVPRWTHGGGEAFDSYERADLINDAVARLVQSNAEVTIAAADAEVGNPTPLGKVVGQRGDREAVIVDIGERELELVPEREYLLHGRTAGVRSAVRARFLERIGHTAHFVWPTQLMVWKARQGTRLRKLPATVRVTFTPPLSRQARTRPIIDLAARGLALRADPEDRLMVGMVLSDVTVQLVDERVKARAIVRHARKHTDGTLIAGVELIGMMAPDARKLEDFLEHRVHPLVRRVAGTDADRLWQFYGRVGLLDHVPITGDAQRRKMKSGRAALLQRGRDLLISMAGGAEGGDIDGIVELIRSTERGWMLQHLEILPASLLTPEQMVVPLVDAALANRAFLFLHTMIEPSHPDAMARLATLEPDPSTVMWRVWTLLTPGPDYTPSDDDADVRGSVASDAAWLRQKLDAFFSPVELRGFDLTGTDLSLTEIRRRYGAMNLERTRSTRIASNMGGPLGLALLESTAPGVNLRGALDVARLVPTARLDASRITAVRSLADDAVKLQRQAGRVPRVLVEPELSDSLLDLGFVSLGTRVDLVTDRSAAAQVVNFITLLR